MVFDRLDKTLDNINRQTNLRTENEQLLTIQITLTEDNYHQRHRYITIHEVEPHTDHNQGIIITTT